MKRAFSLANDPMDVTVSGIHRNDRVKGLEFGEAMPLKARQCVGNPHAVAAQVHSSNAVRYFSHTDGNLAHVRTNVDHLPALQSLESRPGSGTGDKFAACSLFRSQRVQCCFNIVVIKCPLSARFRNLQAQFPGRENAQRSCMQPPWTQHPKGTPVCAEND